MVEDDRCKKVKRIRLYSEAKRLYAKRKMIFKGKQLYLEKCPRIGICCRCGKTGKTGIHHEEYHADDVLKDTLELCKSCHMKRSWELGQLKGEQISLWYKQQREQRRRYCYGCSSNKTTVNKKDNAERWTLNRGTDLMLCRNCTYSVLGV